MQLSTVSNQARKLFRGLSDLFLDDASSSAADRRAYPRVKVRFEGLVDFEGRRLAVRGIDLHRAGAGIVADEALPEGALVFLYEKTHGLMGWATVRWSSQPGWSKYYAGLEFRGSLMRAEVGSWQFSYVQSPECAMGIPSSN